MVIYCHLIGTGIDWNFCETPDCCSPLNFFIAFPHANSFVMQMRTYITNDGERKDLVIDFTIAHKNSGSKKDRT
jgi:hypothetical protein